MEEDKNACQECGKIEQYLARGKCNTCYSRWLYHANPAFAERQRLNSRTWQKKNTERKAGHDKLYRQRPDVKERDKHNKRVIQLAMYGLTPETYNVLYTKQNGECGICHKWFTLLEVDHSHVTGKVRGLLCKGCNFFVGQLERQLLKNALAYLEMSK